MEIVISAVSAFIIGYLISFLVSRIRKQAAETESAVLRSQLDVAVRQVEEIRKESAERISAFKEEAERQRQKALEAADAVYMNSLAAKDKACSDRLAEQEKRHNEAMSALQARFDEVMQKVTAHVRTATDDMLKQRQEEFSKSSNTNLGQIVNPLKETIENMRRTLDENKLKQTEISAEMKTAAENMMRQSEAARKSADELARAFRYGTKVQGDWGEKVLDGLLQSLGLTPGVHYDVQPVIRDASGNVVRTEAGTTLRPDIILHLDTRRDVIIDSKVSLAAFNDYVNAETEEDRRKFLKAHIDSIEKHVRELSAKDYSSYIQPPKVRMNYVIMFVPHTGALWTALDSCPDLWRRAMDRNVFIADEQTLFAALRIIDQTWTQIAQAENHEKVYSLANEMLDRVGQFIKHFDAIGKSLESARKAYDDAGAKLSTGRQSITGTCAKLQKLGARQSGKNPIPQLTDIDDIPAIAPDTADSGDGGVR